MIKKISQEIEKMSGKHSSYQVFSDWVETMALSISNASELIHGELWEKREAQYMSIVQRHDRATMEHFVELTWMLTQALDENIEDVLGAVCMSGAMGNKSTGQFFTPFNLTMMVAQMTVPKDISYENPLILNEPCAGGGGMMIAAAKVLLERGLNPQRCMRVIAQDLDWRGVYMTYVQLSLLGIKAIVAQGDTLTEPYKKEYPPERVFYTPAQKGMLI